jgi:membrane associated rhomboid family serine protease
LGLVHQLGEGIDAAGPALLAAPERDEDAASIADEAGPVLEIIGPVTDRGVAREWALVLQSQAIAYVMLLAPGGWVLRVAGRDFARALDHIERYEDENVDWPPPDRRAETRHPPSPLVPLFFLAVTLFFFYVTGPASARSVWLERGRADAALLWREPWRMVTALTLHSDAAHVLGNLVAGSIFGAALGRRLGPGGGLFALVAAGALGNTANALYHLAHGHRSIGASTAVFGAIGALAAVQTVLVLTERDRWRRRLALVDVVGPLVGGLALLGALGSGRDSDLGAHGFGFAAGCLAVLPVAWFVRWRDRPPSRSWQIGLALVALALVIGSWLAAMRP